jgi:hypothetical protein
VVENRLVEGGQLLRQLALGQLYTARFVGYATDVSTDISTDISTDREDAGR